MQRILTGVFSNGNLENFQKCLISLLENNYENQSIVYLDQHNLGYQFQQIFNTKHVSEKFQRGLIKNNRLYYIYVGNTTNRFEIKNSVLNHFLEHDFYSFIEDHVSIHKHKIKTCLDVFNQYPQVGFCYSDTLSQNGIQLFPSFSLKKINELNNIVNNVVFSKDMLEDTGAFDSNEDFGIIQRGIIKYLGYHIAEPMQFINE